MLGFSRLDRQADLLAAELHVGDLLDGASCDQARPSQRRGDPRRAIVQISAAADVADFVLGYDHGAAGGGFDLVAREGKAGVDFCSRPQARPDQICGEFQRSTASRRVGQSSQSLLLAGGDGAALAA